MYLDNHFSQCSKCTTRWWIVDTPVLGICPVCCEEAIRGPLDVRATLDATLHEPYKTIPTADVPPMGIVDAGPKEADYGHINLEEDEDVTMVSDVWSNSTLIIDPKFDPKKYRQWIDLLALNFLKKHQRRPENPSIAYRLDESEADRFIEPKAETGGPVADDDETDVIVEGKYDGSVTS